MSRIALLLLLCMGAFVACDAKRVRAGGVRLGANPGAIIKIRRVALDKVFNGLTKLAGRYAHKLPIPDVDATVSGVDIATRDLRIHEFAEPEISYSLVPPNRISGSLEFPSITIQGPFNATRRTLIANQKDNGVIIFKASNIQVSFDATIGELETGVPHIAKFECTASLGPANLNVRDAKQKFAIEVLGLFAKTIRPVYNSQVCSTAKRLISGQVNRLLGKIPNTISINQNLALKFQVKPEVDEDHVKVSLFGKVLTEEVSPFQPSKFVEAPSDNAHVVLLISDAPFNDVAYQAYVNKKLDFTINQNSHRLIYSLLQLKCDRENEACLGNVAPALAPKYGEDALVEATFRAVKAPEIEFVPNQAKFKAALAADLTVTPTNDTSKPFHEATAAVEVSGVLRVRIDKDKGALVAKIDIQEVTVHIDEEHNRKWEDKIRGTIEKVLEKYVNHVLLRGVPLKLPFGVGVTEPLITFDAHTLQAHTGFERKVQTSSEEEKAPQ